jgi:hypothetical protein
LTLVLNGDNFLVASSVDLLLQKIQLMRRMTKIAFKSRAFTKSALLGRKSAEFGPKLCVLGPEARKNLHIVRNPINNGLIENALVTLQIFALLFDRGKVRFESFGNTLGAGRGAKCHGENGLWAEKVEIGEKLTDILSRGF